MPRRHRRHRSADLRTACVRRRAGDRPPATPPGSNAGCGSLSMPGGSDLLLVAGAPPVAARRGHGSDHSPTGRSTASMSRKPWCRRWRHMRGGAIATARHRRRVVPRRRDWAASASTCTANAVARPPRCARCRPGCRASPRSAAQRRTAHAPAARSRAHRRPDRLRQDDDAGGAGRGDQSPRRPAHRHHRRSDRVRARAPCQRRRAGRDRRRRARLSRRRCARRSARRPTSSSSVRCAIRRRCGLRCRQRRQGTSCCRRCTRPTPRRRSPASPIRFPTSGRTRSGRSCRWRWRR